MGDVFYNAYQNKGDFLLFEDQIGMSQAITERQLTMILRHAKVSSRVQCVVLAAGNSLELGKVFSRFGVPHVICTNRLVNDLALPIFTQKFYENLFSKKKTICDAFEDTIDHIKSMWHENKAIGKEWAKFKLFSECIDCRSIVE